MFLSEDNLVEGIMAHQYKNEEIKKQIKENYDRRYRRETSPIADPENYDPCNPPKGWAYDPYYECWIKINE
jgi:hypothetical protein